MNLAHMMLLDEEKTPREGYNLASEGLWMGAPAAQGGHSDGESTVSFDFSALLAKALTR